MSKSLIFAHFLCFGERCERFAHDRSFPLSDVSELLRSLTKNEQCERIAQVAHQKLAMWANPSGRSPKMSKYERFAHIAQRKWAIVSESLRLLTNNGGISESLILLSELLMPHIWAKIERFARKTDERIPSPGVIALAPSLHLIGAKMCAIKKLCNYQKMLGYCRP